MATAQLIAVDPDALKDILAKLASLEEQIRAARIAPEPQWLTVPAYAERIGRSVDTVMRKVRAGEVETRHEAGVRMVKV